MCGFTAQLIEHRTGIAEVTASNPVESLIFLRLLPSNCLNWKIYCHDHSSLPSTAAVQIYEFYIYIFPYINIWRERVIHGRAAIWHFLFKCSIRILTNERSHRITIELNTSRDSTSPKKHDVLLCLYVNVSLARRSQLNSRFKKGRVLPFIHWTK